MSTEEQLDYIEQYIEGHLSEAERAAFEERMTQDPALAKEVEQYRTTIFLIKADGVLSLKKKLEGYSNFSKSKKTDTTPFITKWYVWAAAASVTLIIMLVLIFRAGPADTQQLFTAYFEVPPTDRQILRNNENTEENIKAFLAYEQADYGEALKLFEKLIEKEPTDDLLFYSGATALADDEPEKAIVYFSKLLQTRNTPYQWRGKWYLSLAYLKAKDLQKTKTTLQQLVSEPNSYTDKASELLEELE